MEFIQVSPSRLLDSLVANNFYRAMHQQEGDKLVMKSMNLAGLKKQPKRSNSSRRVAKSWTLFARKKQLRMWLVFGLFLVGDSMYVFIHHYSKRSVHYMMRKVDQIDKSLAQRWLKQLGPECEYMHKKGIGHRSIRVEHLLLDENNNLHLTGWSRSIFLLNPVTGLCNAQSESGFHLEQTFPNASERSTLTWRHLDGHLQSGLPQSNYG